MAERKDYIESVLANPIFREVELDSRISYLSKTVELKSNFDFTPDKCIRYAFLLMSSAYSEMEIKELMDELSDEIKYRFKEIYYLLRSIDIEKQENIDDFSSIFSLDPFTPTDLFYFYLATSGLLSENNIKVRIDLKNYQYEPINSDDWRTRVSTQILRAVILLVRKQNGLKDAEEVIQIVNNLIKEQTEYEAKHIEGLSTHQKVPAALELLGLYHISKIIVETAHYLTQGYQYKSNLQSVINRHSRYAKEAFSTNEQFFPLISLIMWTCYEVQRNSIWFSTAGLGLYIETLCKKLVSLDKIDLLPSQRKALSNSILDIASNTTIVQMPTSAGKTLLAEFRILQAKALNTNVKVIYLVPTRALVNQVVADLRTDFEGLNLKIEKTSKVNDIDPTENAFLAENVDILVSTPEKFDLMIRKNHPAVETVDLVIVDEAHNIREGDRGAKLELLLAIIKRERPNAKFLLLSPFLPKAETLKDWLTSGKTSIKPIEVDWRPADRVFIGINEDKDSQIHLTFEPSPHSFLTLSKKKTISLTSQLELSTSKKRERLAEATAKLFGEKGNTVLFLCQGKKTAQDMATWLGTICTNKKMSYRHL